MLARYQGDFRRQWAPHGEMRVPGWDNSPRHNLRSGAKVSILRLGENATGGMKSHVRTSEPEAPRMFPVI